VGKERDLTERNHGATLQNPRDMDDVVGLNLMTKQKDDTYYYERTRHRAKFSSALLGEYREQAHENLPTT
jgi:hypothetical protein